MKFAFACLVALVAIVAVAAQAPTAPISGGSSFVNTNCAAGTCNYKGKCYGCNAGTYEPAWSQECAADTPKVTGYPCAHEPGVGDWAPAKSHKSYACPAGTSSKGGRSATGCTECDYGTYTNKVGMACKTCPSGTYQALAGQTSCKKCPAGSKSVPNRGQCVLPNGAPATDPASFMEMEAEQKPAATTPTESSDPVPPITKGVSFVNANCAAGTCLYQGKCYSCNAGTFEPAWSQACAADTPKVSGYPCDQVPKAGHWSPAKSEKTYACPAGTTSPGGRVSTGCTQCNYGTYSNKPGMECKKCPEGTYQPAPGQKSCKKCPKNSTSVENRGQCVKSNGAPATKPALVEIEAEFEQAPDADDEVHPFTPITPGTKFPGAAMNPIEQLKARVTGSQ